MGALLENDNLGILGQPTQSSCCRHSARNTTNNQYLQLLHYLQAGSLPANHAARDIQDSEAVATEDFSCALRTHAGLANHDDLSLFRYFTESALDYLDRDVLCSGGVT